MSAAPSPGPADPLTDREAAERFTKDHAWTPHWGYERVSLVQAWPGKNHGKPLCRASVHDEGRGAGFHQCPLPGKTQTADGAWWCRVHEPAALAARRAKREAKYAEREAAWAAKMAAEARRRAPGDGYPKLVAALEEIAAGHNDPRALAREVLDALAPKP